MGFRPCRFWGGGGGPDWIGTDGFDIIATFDPDELIGWNRWEQRDHPKLMAMLRTLLAERFRLQLHIETRELEYYAMVRTRPGAPLGKAFSPRPRTVPRTTKRGNGDGVARRRTRCRPVTAVSGLVRAACS